MIDIRIDVQIYILASKIKKYIYIHYNILEKK